MPRHEVLVGDQECRRRFQQRGGQVWYILGITNLQLSHYFTGTRGGGLCWSCNCLPCYVITVGFKFERLLPITLLTITYNSMIKIHFLKWCLVTFTGFEKPGYLVMVGSTPAPPYVLKDHLPALLSSVRDPFYGKIFAIL